LNPPLLRVIFIASTWHYYCICQNSPAPRHAVKTVKTVNQAFSQLTIEQAPDKSFIGNIAKGFDFLGDHFDGKYLTVAAKTVEKHV